MPRREVRCILYRKGGDFYCCFGFGDIEWQTWGRGKGEGGRERQISRGLTDRTRLKPKRFAAENAELEHIS